MSKKLVIVESPAKAKTIKKFLGSSYDIEASMGHVRDLPKKKADLPEKLKSLPYASLGVDTEHDFSPLYVVSPDKKEVISKLKKKLEASDELYIATDEDREGEAIGWHLIEALKPKKKTHIHRIAFHEITKEAILNALENPRKIDLNLVHAQQARRILDRLVGYKLSPLLWQKVRTGLSAGRVQSVAVRLIVEREREIRAFKTEEYWTIEALLLTEKKEVFETHLLKINDKKVEIHNEKEAKKILDALKHALFKVHNIARKEIRKNPAPPFTTSTLQQEAARKLGFTVKKTMVIAQKLYEGVNLKDEGSTGLITYMRTDSVNLSNKALIDAKKVIGKLYGKEYSLGEPRKYKTKAKGAQEAHEAIRPTELSRLPEDVKDDLGKDEFRLYEIIWKRTLASQMEQAILDSISVDILALPPTEKEKFLFRANGQTIKFPGFMRVYVEGSDSPEKELETKEKLLPPLSKKEKIKPKEIIPEQHFTKPPPRYTEAALVKKLEEEGIGRPSTYAPTINTIMVRGYVEKEEKALKPTDVAFIVNDLLVRHFPKIVDIKFTARMETDLDSIAEGKHEWVPFLREFYDPFEELIEVKKKEINRQEIISEETDEKCEKCGRKMVIKLGRRGKFMSCSGYPECKNAKPIINEEQEKKIQELQKKHKGEKCEKCGSEMIIKTGPYGEFLACSNYPACKTIKSIIKSTGVKCPECKKGELNEKRTKKGKFFYGCSNYPKCKFAVWNKPIKKACPDCGGLQTETKTMVKCAQCGRSEKK